MIVFKSIWALGLAGAVLAAGAGAASAGPSFRFAGDGLGSATVEANAHIAPGIAFSFSFLLPDPLPADAAPGGAYEVIGASGVRFTLGGRPVDEPLEQIVFYDAANGGGFDLLFSVDGLNLFGPDIASDGVPRLGTYAVEYGTGGNRGGGFGTLTVSRVVPEPASWAMMIAGFGMVGTAMRRRMAIA